MLKVGLTGSIGSGKSLVAGIFSAMGIPVYNADNESKKFLAFPGIKTRIVESFGQEILSPSGEIDRKKLGDLVFPDPSLLTSLNAILHPLVMKDFSEWCASNYKHPYIIQESAIIIESVYRMLFDKIILVSSPREIAIERVMLRDNSSLEEVIRRMQYQFEDSKKAAMSDYIIRNDGSEMIIPQILSIHHELLQSSA